jgi:hypothetical protein
MGLFPSEAEVVRRRRRDRNMLYTEPDDYSEPRGTNEGKTAGTNEAKARRKRGLEDVLASAQELQRIEDEMDDEPILSAVLTASAARKPRGEEKKERNSKKEKKDTRKGEDRRKGEDSRKDEKMKGDPGDQNDGKRARSADKQDTSTPPLHTPNPRDSVDMGNSIKDLSTLALVSELARRCALSGGEMATDIVEAAQRAIWQLPTIAAMPLVLAAATEGDAMSLALLSVILCYTMGRALSRVNVRRISVTLWSLVVRGSLSLHSAMQRLTNTAALIEEEAGALVSVIEAVVERALLAYTKLSIGFIVGAYTIVTVQVYCMRLEPRILKFTSSLWGSVQGAGLRHVLGAVSILILIAAVLQIIVWTWAYMLRIKPGGTTRRIKDSVNRAVSAIRTKRNFKKVGLLFMLTSMAADMISSAVYAERGVRLSDGPIPHVFPQLGIFPDSSHPVISGLLDVIGKPSSTIRLWVWSNIAPLHTAATDFIRNNIQEPSRPPIGNESSSVPVDKSGSDPDNGSEPPYTKAQAAHWRDVLTSALNNATDTSVSPSGVDSMIKLYQVTKDTFKEAASVITEAGVAMSARVMAPWDSVQSLKDAHESAKTFAVKGKYDVNFQDALNRCFLKLQEMHNQWTTEFEQFGHTDLDPARLMHLAATATCSKSGPAGPAGPAGPSGPAAPSEEIAGITQKLEDMRNKITNKASPAATMITSLLDKLCHKNPPTAEPTRDYSGLSSALARWESIGPTMDDLEQVSRELLESDNLNVPEWTSLEEIQFAIQHLERLAAGSELVKKLLERIKASFNNYQNWDKHLRIILEKADLSLDALPNIVQIYSLAERALPNDNMPYKRTVYGAIERDNDRAPVKVSADAGPTDSTNQAVIDQLLVIDKAILEKQPDVTSDPEGHEKYEEHRYELADFIAMISGYKGEALAASVTDKLYALSLKVASAKAIGDTAELRNALKAFVEENKKEEGFTAFLPILKGELPTEAIAPYNGPDLKLNAAHRVYEFLREHTAAPNNNGTQHETQRPPNKVLSEEIAATLDSAVNQYKVSSDWWNGLYILEDAVIQALRYLGVPTWDTLDEAGIETINIAIGMVEDINKRAEEGLDKARINQLLIAAKTIQGNYIKWTNHIISLDTKYSLSSYPGYEDVTLLRHLARQATVSKMPYKIDERGNIEFNENGELIQVKASDDHQSGNGTASLTPQHTERFQKAERSLISIAKGIWARLKSADGTQRPPNTPDQMWAQIKEKQNKATDLAKDGCYVALLIARLHGDRRPLASCN